MVNRRDENREDFIIDGGYGEDEADDLRPEEYHGTSSQVFRNKSIMPFVIGGVGLIVLVIFFVVYLSKPNKRQDQEYLQTLEARMQQLESKLGTIGMMDQTLKRIGKQEQKLALLEKNLARLESTVATQIDQILKELNILHQKTGHKTDSKASAPQKAEEKKPVASKKTETKAKFHQVQAGETLYGISRRYGLSVEQLRSYNNLAPNTAIYPGQKLKVGPD
jgi:LysM repeat protein